MTPIRATSPKTAVFEQWRTDTIEKIGGYGDLAEAPWDVVGKIEIFPGCRLDAPKLVVPADWVPSGGARRLSRRTIDPSLAGIDPDPEFAKKRDETVRRALLALWLPRATKKGVHSYKPRSWVGRALGFLQMCNWQMVNRPAPNGSVLSHLTLADLMTGMDDKPTKRKRDDVQSIVRSLLSAAYRGVISDYPRVFDDIRPGNGQGYLEKGRKGDAAPAVVEKQESRSFQPFSDEFVTEIVSRAIWFQTTLAPSLIRCWKGLRDITDNDYRRAGHPSVLWKRKRFFEEFVWTDPAGNVINSIPYAFEQWIDGQTVVSNAWPPQHAETVNRLLGTLQILNLCMVAFCTGARDSELAATEDTVGEDRDHRFHSITFKLVEDFHGSKRDWPLHPSAVRALEVQHEIAKLVRPSDQKHAWVMLGLAKTRGQPLIKLTDALDFAVRHLALSDLTGTDRAHMHRWRHTIARLVALSVIGAPQVLLDLFGHRNLEMTLRYMLSDPTIMEDSMKVAKETAFAQAESAIVETMNGMTSGPAAPLLKKGIESAAMQRGEDTFKAADLRELTEVLTFQGRNWSLVREGVICTKGLGEFGPCTQGKGAPDPGSCRTDCGHRLETARAKQSCESALRALLREREHVARAGDEMLLANLDGQIVGQMKRWDDVRERILSEFPEIAGILEGERA
jgi:integrase